MKKYLSILFLIAGTVNSYSQARENFVSAGFTVNDAKVNLQDKTGYFIGIASSGPFENKKMFGVIGELQFVNHRVKDKLAYNEYSLLVNFAPYYRLFPRLKFYTGIQFGGILYASIDEVNLTDQIPERIFSSQSGLIYKVNKKFGASVRYIHKISSDQSFTWTGQVGVNYSFGKKPQTGIERK